MSDGRLHDPSRVVNEPLERALGVLILVGMASFVLAVFAVVLALEPAAGPAHEGAHVALAVVMLVVVVARAIYLVRTGGRSDTGAWDRAREVHRTDTRIAELLTLAVPLAWLVGSASIAIHHVPLVIASAPFAGALLPMAAALWILAAFAWHGFCTDRIGRALEESDRRYRDYWRTIATR